MRYQLPCILGVVVIMGIILTSFAPAVDRAAKGPASQNAMLSVAEFLPKGYATDGSVSYQVELQKAIDTAAATGQTLVFPRMVYRLDETGLQLRSHLAIWAEGAIFQMDEKCAKDGQAFLAHDVVGLQFHGGEIAGRNDVWAEGVNIRGIKSHRQIEEHPHSRHCTCTIFPATASASSGRPINSFATSGSAT